jgi:hypothetical protein
VIVELRRGAATKIVRQPEGTAPAHDGRRAVRVLDRGERLRDVIARLCPARAGTDPLAARRPRYAARVGQREND